LYSISDSRPFWESPWLERLEGLDLDGLDGSSFLEAVIAGRLPRLKELRLFGRRVNDGLAAFLATLPQFSPLRELILDGVSLDDDVARALASAPYLSALTSLTFHEGIALTDTGREALRQRFGERLYLLPRVRVQAQGDDSASG
jgi:hypothetical protein